MKLRDLPPALRAKASAQLPPRRRKTDAERAVEAAKAKAQRMLFFFELGRAGLPLPEFEHRFHPSRAWRFDYCWPDQKLAIEVDGGIYTGGKHGRGAGIEKDMEKANHAAALGWRVMRTTPRKLAKPTTISLIRLALEV